MKDPIMNFNLEKDVFGNIRLVLGSGQSHDQVKIIRAFPISDQYLRIT